MDFYAAVELVILSEGGSSVTKNPNDPGGTTKYGISQRAYPGEDIENLSKERALFLYKRDYWGPAGCDAVPSIIKYPLLDMAVNQGVVTAIKTLQKVCGEIEDGVLGPRTLLALSSIDTNKLFCRFMSARIKQYTNNPNWDTFGKGWVRRIAFVIGGSYG